MVTINKSIFKAYDIRGIYNTDIDEDVVRLIAQGLALMWEEGVIVVARDGRHGGKELAQALMTEIRSSGQRLGKKFTLIDAGVATTPMYYFVVNHLSATGGAMVTASHNPKEYTGIKAVSQYALPVVSKDLLDLMEREHIV